MPQQSCNAAADTRHQPLIFFVSCICMRVLPTVPCPCTPDWAGLLPVRALQLHNVEALVSYKADDDLLM